MSYGGPLVTSLRRWTIRGLHPDGRQIHADLTGPPLEGDEVIEVVGAPYTQYRPVCRDRSDDPDRPDSYDYGDATSVRERAEAELEASMISADPPYDEGYVEHRFLSAWERE